MDQWDEKAAEIVIVTKEVDEHQQHSLSSRDLTLLSRIAAFGREAYALGAADLAAKERELEEFKAGLLVENQKYHEQSRLRHSAESLAADLTDRMAEAEQDLRMASGEFVRIYGESPCRHQKESGAGEELTCYHRLAARGMEQADRAIARIQHPRVELAKLRGAVVEKGRIMKGSGYDESEMRAFEKALSELDAAEKKEREGAEGTK